MKVKDLTKEDVGKEYRLIKYVDDNDRLHINEEALKMMLKISCNIDDIINCKFTLNYLGKYI